MTHKVHHDRTPDQPATVHMTQSRLRQQRRPSTLTQLNAEYVSRINTVLEQGRDDLARQLAADFDADHRRIAGQC